MKTFIYVALCLVVPPVWALITYYVFSFLHGKVKAKVKPESEGPGPDSRAAG